jgi:hypothetical protein
MKPQEDALVPAQGHDAVHKPIERSGSRRAFSLSQLVPTPSRTQDDILRLIRQGRLAEMTPHQAGYED